MVTYFYLLSENNDCYNENYLKMNIRPSEALWNYLDSKSVYDNGMKAEMKKFQVRILALMVALFLVILGLLLSNYNIVSD